MITILKQGSVASLGLLLLLTFIALPAHAYRITYEHYVFATGEGAVPVRDDGFLTNGPLSYSFSHTHVGEPAAGNSATVDYFADIDEATLGAYASSVSAQADLWPWGFTGTGRVETIQFEVALSFDVPAGTYPDTLEFTVEGEVVGSVAAHGQATAQANFGARFGAATWYPDLIQIGLDSNNTVPVDEEFALVHRVPLPGGILTEPATYDVDLVCYLANLITSATETGSYPNKETGYSSDDFSGGLRITAVAGPPGATWSSDSGVFLDEEDISAAGSTPQARCLGGNVPNPFNPSTEILYHLAQAGPVDLVVYDLAGRLVQRLESGMRGAGDHRAEWNGRDAQGREVPSGTYFAVLETGVGREMHKMMLVR